jgi:hypothetical protein
MQTLGNRCSRAQRCAYHCAKPSDHLALDESSSPGGDPRSLRDQKYDFDETTRLLGEVAEHALSEV